MRAGTEDEDWCGVRKNCQHKQTASIGRTTDQACAIPPKARSPPLAPVQAPDQQLFSLPPPPPPAVRADSRSATSPPCPRPRPRPRHQPPSPSSFPVQVPDQQLFTPPPLSSWCTRRYLISNCKDQSIKLWDLRHCLVSDRQAREFAERPDIPSFRWDYRSVAISRGGGGSWHLLMGGGFRWDYRSVAIRGGGDIPNVR